MNRYDLQNLAKKRVKEAKVLLNNKHFEGAYYLLGYSVECAFKAYIAKKTRRYEFPDKNVVNNSYTHDIVKLLGVSGLKRLHQEEIDKNLRFNVNWAIVKDWSAQSRYSNNITEKKAKDFYSAVTNRKNGFLSWIRKLW